MSKKKSLQKAAPSKLAIIGGARFNNLYKRISKRLHEGRSNAARSVNTIMVETYWYIGQQIIEEEQLGKSRAGYGQDLINRLSVRLTREFGAGFSATNIKYMRNFYLIYQYVNPIRQLSAGELVKRFNPNLTWSHYRILSTVSSKTKRGFYEVEAINNCWGYKEMDRQIASLLFERLAKSKDKKGVLRLAQRGQEIQTPEDVMKDPMVLEFLDLPESHQLVETKIEEALVNNLQKFLLELGRGFAFVARQQRLTLDGDHLYVDLVFYHTILKCYLLIDIKTKKLTHGDMGQMLNYVNYYDRECLSEGDNPTLGLILCTEKNDAAVRYTLADKEKQIFASKYQFLLPTEEELRKEMKRELKDIKYRLSHKSK